MLFSLYASLLLPQSAHQDAEKCEIERKVDGGLGGLIRIRTTSSRRCCLQRGRRPTYVSVCVYASQPKLRLDFHSKVLNGRNPKLSGFPLAILVWTLVRYARDRRTEKFFRVAGTTSPVVNGRDGQVEGTRRRNKATLFFVFFRFL